MTQPEQDFPDPKDFQDYDERDSSEVEDIEDMQGSYEEPDLVTPEGEH